MRYLKIFPVLLLAGLATGCASLPPGAQRDPRDPMERTNRAIYKFNDALDRGVAKPVAVAYTKVTPAPVRTGVSNFFRNLTYPTVIVNQLLQGKVAGMFVSTARLVVNSTIGIGGLFDPASQMGIPSHDEDFGQTLGAWGIPSGPYMVLPVLGPSSARDTVGVGGDFFTDPKRYAINDRWTRYGLTAFELVDRRAELLGTDEVLGRSFDPYVFMRNAYLQRREFQVKDGTPPDEAGFEIFEDESDPADPAEEGTPAAVPVQ